MHIISCLTLPQHPDLTKVYRLTHISPDDAYYKERTNRHLGWITEAEQEMLRNSVVGISGCGGMGGLIASTLIRLGVGEVRIADCEVFDISNINRQFAATRGNIGQSKAFATARMIREITDDSTLVVYPQGIAEETVESFLQNLDVVCDEIEFWAVGARILLHQKAREKGIHIYNCNTVGFGTRLFYFEPKGFTMEETLGMTFEKAMALQTRIQSKEAEGHEIAEVMSAVLGGLVPEIPEYGASPDEWSTVRNVKARLYDEGRAMIIATNPPMASGFLCDHILFYLLRNSPVNRNLVTPVAMPGYLYFDAGTHTAKRIERQTI